MVSGSFTSFALVLGGLEVAAIVLRGGMMLTDAPMEVMEVSLRLASRASS